MANAESNAKREELELRKMEIEIMVAVIKNYQELCADTTMDERAKDMFKDAILSDLTRRSVPQRVPTAVVQEKKDKKQFKEIQLIERFNSAFIITEYACCPIHERILYDTMLALIPKSEQEAFIESMYAACHPGEKLSSRDRKNFKAGKRVGKTSFNWYLKAIGGVCKTTAMGNVWVNVEIRI